MKRFLTLIAALLFLLSLSACQARTEVKYLQTSVTQEYIGKVTFRSELQYDENGVQTAFIRYTDGVEVSRVEYTHTDNEIIGKTTQGDETGIIRQKYEKDAAGNITKLEMYVDDTLYSVIENTYDEAGNILTSVQDSFFTGISRITSACTYDSKGNQIRITYDYGDGICSVVDNSFDENGTLISTATSDLMGNVTRREAHSRDESGAGIVKTFDAEGNLLSTRFDTYDEHGNVLISETFDENGALMLRITYTYQRFELPIK